MTRYRRKPIDIEAMLWTGYNYTEAEQFMGEALGKGIYQTASRERSNGWTNGPYSNSAKIILTLEGDMRCQPGDWIIKGVMGEFYPCRPGIFDATYEKVEP